MAAISTVQADLVQGVVTEIRFELRDVIIKVNLSPESDPRAWAELTV